jgi:hypothetical protein
LLTAIQLSLFLRQDDVTAPGALPDVLGDAYLCKNNPIYAAMRAAALANGFSDSGKPTSLWYDYQVCPLSCLFEVLSRKTSYKWRTSPSSRAS